MGLKTWLGIGAAIGIVAAALSEKSKPSTNEHDAEKEIYRTNQMPEDNETYVRSEPTIVEVTCKNCGAEMQLNNDRSIIRCPYCDSKKIVIEPATDIARDQHRTYSEVERSKHEIYSKIALERERTKQQEIKNGNTVSIIGLVLIVIGFLPLITYALKDSFNKPTHENEVQIPTSAKGYNGEDVNITVKALKAVGFTDIETEGLGDLTTGWIKKENTIDSIYINGDSTFAANTWFSCDAQITIYYHSFPENESD